MPTERQRKFSHGSRCGEHSKYLELCALFTTGSLDRDDLRELDLHLENCEECRAALAGYYYTVRSAVPLLAADQEEEQGRSLRWNQSKAKKQLFASLEKGTAKAPKPLHAKIFSGILPALPGTKYLILGALGILVGLAGYVIGSGRRQQVWSQQRAFRSSDASFASQLGDLAKHRDQLEAQIKQRDELISRLSAEVAKQTGEISRLQKTINESAALSSQQASSLTILQQKSATVVAERAETEQKLQQAETSLADLQHSLERLQSERVADLLQTAGMQRQIDDLTGQVDTYKSTIAEQQHIRELMGARELHMADVFDVDQNGNTQKAFGRVFYTKNKPLILYAFDLDKQPHLRNASAFQAWGERSSDKRPVSLGMLYMDNEANRRWKLKFDNTQVIEQLSAVFVTIEPKGGSDKPSGKQLLYAALPTQANHQ